MQLQSVAADVAVHAARYGDGDDGGDEDDGDDGDDDDE